MARCEECLHFELCEALEQANGLMKVPPIHCGFYKTTADVVPKSEVDLYKRQVDELEDELASSYDKLENARSDVAKEIFEEIDEILHYHGITIGLVFDEANGADVAIGRIEKMISELKKKYTEGGE